MRQYRKDNTQSLRINMLYRLCLLAIVPCAHPRLAAKARKETYITALRLHVIDFGSVFRRSAPVELWIRDARHELLERLSGEKWCIW